MRNRKPSAASMNSRIRGESFEIVGVIPEGYAAVALAVIVAALEAAALVPEHERARCQQPVSDVGSVLEAAREHDGDGRTRVLLFVAAILGSAGADDVGHRPAIAARNDARRRSAWRTGLPPVCQGALEFDRNFCQDVASVPVA
jgi:hypothetical protein